MSVAIVTVNWNRWQLTLRCVESARASRYADLHVYVVDNRSSDDSLGRLAGLGPGATLIAHDHNAGWAGGNNVGLVRALADGHDFIFLLNNDAELEPDTLTTLLDAHEGMVKGSSPAPVLGAIERRSDGSHGFVRAAVQPASGLPSKRLGAQQGPPLEPLIETAYVHGAALFAHRSLFGRVGPFDERFFLNFDEVDWCYRAARLGHPLRIVRDAFVRHDGGETIGPQGSLLKAYFLARNRFLFAEKHCTPEQRRVIARAYQRSLARIENENSPRAFVLRQAAEDYVARRFGNCPPEVRRLARQ